MKEIIDEKIDERVQWAEWRIESLGRIMTELVRLYKEGRYWEAYFRVTALKDAAMDLESIFREIRVLYEIKEYGKED